MRTKLAPIGAVALRGLCLAALGCVAWLLLATIAIGAVTGWDRTVIISGSMEPSLQAGDVLLNGPPEAERLDVGSVVTFPRHDGEAVSHRVVAVEEGGSLLTRGDANPTIDSDPVAPDDVDGVGRLVVPLVGTPRVWLAEGRLFDLALLVLALVTLVVGAIAVRPPEPTAERTTGPPTTGDEPEGTDPRPARRAPATTVVRPIVLIAGLGVLIVLTVQLRVANAAFVATSPAPVSSVGAAPSFCTAPPTTLGSIADATIRQNQAGSAFGTQATAQVQSRNNGRNRRMLVRFDLPAVPPRCQLASATLRLFATSSSPNRTVQVRSATASWSEAVTWNSQPGVSGATSSGPSGNGWRTWDVTSQVLTQLGGAETGFVLRDAVEGSNGNIVQTFRTREGTNPPQLVLTWSSAP